MTFLSDIPRKEKTASHSVLSVRVLKKNLRPTYDNMTYDIDVSIYV